MAQDRTMEAIEKAAEAAFNEQCKEEGFPPSLNYDQLSDNAKAKWRRMVIKAVNAYEEALKAEQGKLLVHGVNVMDLLEPKPWPDK